jgi:thioredoxin-related protein
MLCSLTTRANSINFIEIKSEQDWEAAFERATEENKLLFIDVYTDWCTYCHKLDKEVYTDEEVISYFNNNFINLKFDAESQFGYQLAQQFNVDGYPTLLFLTSQRETFEVIGGFIPAKTLLAYGEQTLNSYERLPVLEEKYDNLLITKDERLELIGLLEKSKPEKAQIVAKKHIQELISDDYQELETLWLLSRFENQLTGAPYQYITSHKDSIISWHGQEEYNDYMKAVYNDNLQLSIKYGDETLLLDLVTKVLPEFLPEYDLAEGAYITKKLYYSQRQEYDKFTFVVNAYLNNNVAESGKEQFLFETALEIVDSMEGETMHQFAAELLTQAYAINDQSFSTTSLLGYTNGLLGNFQSAIAQLEKAKTLATGAEELDMANGLLQAVNLMKEN